MSEPRILAGLSLIRCSDLRISKGWFSLTLEKKYLTCRAARLPEHPGLSLTYYFSRQITLKLLSCFLGGVL